MMGRRTGRQGALFCGFSLEGHVPADRPPRSIGRLAGLAEVRRQLGPHRSAAGRPSADPELMIRMLLVGGHGRGIRPERRLRREAHLDLAYRRFRRLGLDGGVPDHSTFSKNRHGRVRGSDLLREPFEATARRRVAEGLVGGGGFAADASMIRADARRRRGAADREGLDPGDASRAAAEYLATLGDAAFGAAAGVAPKVIPPTGPAARWTAAAGGPASFACGGNHLIDVEHAVIVDVEATAPVRQAAATAAQARPRRRR